MVDILEIEEHVVALSTLTVIQLLCLVKLITGLVVYLCHLLLMVRQILTGTLVVLVLVLAMLSLGSSLILNLRVGVLVLHLLMVHILFGLRNELGAIQEILQVSVNRLHILA